MPEEFPQEEIDNAAHHVVGDLESSIAAAPYAADHSPDPQPALYVIEGGAEAGSGTPWWEDHWKLKELSAEFDLKLSEVYRVASFGKQIDIVNYSEEILTEDDVEQIGYAISAVASFTGGKIFDRFEGIVMVPRKVVAGRKDYGKDLGPEEEIAASVDSYTGLMTFNIDSMRHPLEQSFKRPNPLINYFLKGRKPSQLEFLIAHELGHFMDLSFGSEIDKHDFDKTKAKPKWNGWATIDGEDYMTKDFDAFDHPNPAVYALERSLTPRASLNASEDFAETFAIAALGGDVSSAPNKHKKLLETIRLAKGEPVVGPHKVQITKIFTRL